MCNLGISVVTEDLPFSELGFRPVTFDAVTIELFNFLIRHKNTCFWRVEIVREPCFTKFGKFAKFGTVIGTVNGESPY